MLNGWVFVSSACGKFSHLPAITWSRVRQGLAPRTLCDRGGEAILEIFRRPAWLEIARWEILPGNAMPVCLERRRLPASDDALLHQLLCGIAPGVAGNRAPACASEVAGQALACAAQSAVNIDESRAGNRDRNQHKKGHESRAPSKASNKSASELACDATIDAYLQDLLAGPAARVLSISRVA
ncbi:MAG: hypothetical protein WBN40_11675 [Pseudomonadales bacterium]